MVTTASRRNMVCSRNRDRKKADTMLVMRMQRKLKTRNQRVRLNGRWTGESAGTCNDDSAFFA